VTPSDEELEALCHKYAELVRLRRLAETAPEHDPRGDLGRLAARYPGALREIDELPLAELQARFDALVRARAGQGPIAEWMGALACFHRLARGALFAKRWLRGRREIDPAMRAAYREACATIDAPEEALVWADALERIARPPSGRLMHLVFEALARALDIPEERARTLVLSPLSRRALARPPE
jgi:hypothetical protein